MVRQHEHDRGRAVAGHPQPLAGHRRVLPCCAPFQVKLGLSSRWPLPSWQPNPPERASDCAQLLATVGMGSLCRPRPRSLWQGCSEPGRRLTRAACRAACAPMPSLASSGAFPLLPPSALSIYCPSRHDGGLVRADPGPPSVPFPRCLSTWLPGAFALLTCNAESSRPAAEMLPLLMLGSTVVILTIAWCGSLPLLTVPCDGRWRLV